MAVGVEVVPVLPLLLLLEVVPLVDVPLELLVVPVLLLELPELVVVLPLLPLAELDAELEEVEELLHPNAARFRQAKTKQRSRLLMMLLLKLRDRKARQLVTIDLNRAHICR